MRKRLLELAEHRAYLVARAQTERAAIDAILAPADAAASLASSLAAAARSAREQARRHPLTVVFGVMLLVALRPRRAMIWLSRGWSLWRLYRGARGWWLRLEGNNTAAAAPKQAW